MSGGFKRSSRFGIVGVLVVMAACVAIALAFGSGPDANQNLTLALIFGVVAVYLIVLFALQRGDLNRTSGADAKSTVRGAVEGGRAVENPTTMSEPELWAALAVAPIDREAIKARSAMWSSGRRSQNLGMLITLLIFLTVPPMYFLESFVPLMIGVPLIVIAALWGSVRALMPGGEMAEGYANVDRAMAPLGLTVTEQPTVSIEMRDPVTPRMGPKIRGALVLEGERHGRRVAVHLDSTETASRSRVTVVAPTPPFEAAARDGRVRPGEGAPAEIAAALAAVPNSTGWKKLDVEGGPEGIVVTRKGGDQGAWLCDLWLAERLAEAP